MANVMRSNRFYGYEGIGNFSYTNPIVIFQLQLFLIHSPISFCRGLSFMEKFLSLFLENETNGVTDENLCSILGKAYEVSLRTHHGWAVRILFNVS